ncbi:TRIM2_3 [Mytilus coruscus]|uniref:TRIM2_3 n=1 Tax=Mytilus coruscus TaxID=42192 RepID=A0A6J8BEC1_MYTCO|nr:TRIM2_3 [Mytilus coruscus]
MAVCSNSNKVDDIDKCGICLSAFTTPILLDCFHIFCTPCISKLTEGKDTVICPLCRAVHVLPDKGVGGLTLYPYVKETDTPDTQSVLFCQMCENEEYTVTNCIDCNCKMCLDCSAYHLKHKIFKTHKTEKIENECTELKSQKTNSFEDDTCKTHNAELSHFCELCNKAICNKCISQNHRLHKKEPILFQAQKRRDHLRLAFNAIKSKAIAINREKQHTESAENNYYQLCRQGKDEIKTHTERSKEIVCKIFDVLADLNLHKMDEMQKQDIKAIHTHQDELETRALSLQCLLRSTDNIINFCSDGKLFNDYTFLYETLKRAATQDNKLEVLTPQFRSGRAIEHKYVEECFGRVERGIRSCTLVVSDSHIYSLPIICEVKELTKKYSFRLEKQDIRNVTSEEYLLSVKTRAELEYEFKIPDENIVTHILQATRNELLVNSGALIKKIHVDTLTSFEDIVKPSESELKFGTCAVVDDNRVVTYSAKGKCFYELTINGDWPIILNETTLKTIHVDENILKLITTSPSKIVETMSKQIILTCKENVITLDRNYRMCNIHENKGSDFRGACRDPYGNVFIVDYNMDKICLFNSYGDFLHDVFVQDISKPVDITRDSVGNIWLADQNNRVQIYSHL